MGALADRSLGQFLEQVAAESPSPGGGSSCALACALAAEELHVYAAVLEVMREPAETSGRSERLDAALSDATDSPLAIARAAAEVAELAAEAARSGNRHLRGDAMTGALLAEAGGAAAAP